MLEMFCVIFWSSVCFWHENAAALAQNLEQSSDTDVEKLKLLKDAIINCRQNEAYLRIIHVIIPSFLLVYNVT